MSEKRKIYPAEILYQSTKKIAFTSSMSHVPPIKSTSNEFLPEILTKVFLYLNLEDRKSSKLVCKDWYEILTMNTFQRNEVTVCRGLYGIRSILSRLMCYKCPLYNVEFQCVQLRESHSFWKDRGHEINELVLRNCEVSDETFSEIIKYCDKLKNLNLDDMDKDGLRCPNECLDSLIRENIVRENLISVKLPVKDIIWLRKIFQLYPRIRRISLYPPRNQFPFNEPLRRIDDYSEFLKELSCSEMMTESLILRFDWDISCFFSKISANTMLQEIEISQIEDARSEAKVFLDFISKQTMLKSIKIFVKNRTSRSESNLINDVHLSNVYLGMTLLKTVIENCPHLRSFHLENGQKQEIEVLDVPLLEKLMMSKLKYLYLNYSMFQLADVQQCKVLPNCTLKYLCLEQRADTIMTEKDYCFFLRAFRGLEHFELHVPRIGSEIFTSIRNYQKKLIKLSLFKYDFYPIGQLFFGWRQHDLSYGLLHLSKIYDLRCLEIPLLLTKNSVPSFNSPNLEYLTIHLTVSQEANATIPNFFNTIAKDLKNLKSLNIMLRATLSNRMLIEVCSTMKSVQYLRIDRQRGISSSIEELSQFEMKKVLKRSLSLRAIHIFEDRFPSLRVVHILEDRLLNTNRWNSVLFFYDRSTNQFLLSTYPLFHDQTLFFRCNNQFFRFSTLRYHFSDT